MSRTNFVLAFFVAALAVGLLMRFHVSIPIPRENFMQKDAGMPLNAPGMGPYDQGVIGGWSANEGMPVGSHPVATPMDGNKLMYLVGNKTDASCCPSAFSTDTGCVCLSGSDLDLMAHRGGNK
jgi:hypothetical protein